MTVTDLAPVGWRVRFVDELSGDTLQEQRVTVTAARPLSLAVPRCTRHVTALITREAGSRP